MDAILLARQGLLFLHLVAFAIAFAEIARADLQLLRAPRIDAVALHRAAQVVSPALLALWASGIGLIVLDKGLDFSAIAASPKLLVKLIVVTVLTANGMLLHRYAFPILARHEARSGGAIAILATLGAISTVSWLYAAFVGSARLIAGTVSLETFLALYGVGLVTGIATAILVVGPLLRERLAAASPRTIVPVDNEAQWAEDMEGHTTVRPIEEPIQLRKRA